MLAGVTGAFGLTWLAGESEALLSAVAGVGVAVGLGAFELFALLHLIGFVALAALGWWLLRWLGRQYLGKRLSDQSLTIDALWLAFAIVQPITFAFEGWVWIFAGLLAFLAYKLTTRLGFALTARDSVDPGPAPLLLLLRVFALGRRSERLFDALSRWWRQIGPMALITGPDLVTSVVEPHEFLDYLGGRLARRFIRDGADLDRRIAALDTEPDPDGRFRVNDLFCHADTWQMSVQRLAARSSVVAMDLRGFSESNQGCVYELGHLIDRVPLDRVLFLVDETTDQRFLDDTLEDLWRKLDAGSPNRVAATPTVRLADLSGQPCAAPPGLLTTLFDGVSAPQGAALA
jgi:hypothetical protein